MRFILPILVLAASVGGVAAALVLPLSNQVLGLAAAGVLIGVLLLLRAARSDATSAPKGPVKWAVLDGSNVMHWREGTPSLQPVQDVLSHLHARGYTAGVVFDANAGYKLMGKYRHDGSLARTLDLPKERVMVVNKGEPADPMILTAARDMGAVVITNDRFRDWAEQFPEVRKRGHLVRGGYRDAVLWLDLPKPVDQGSSKT
ncbi:NYN domain-containing protein [Jannaschia pohangensis]|uniref:Zc3h12a-like Ribonuclease NYN domain-containing protein n=1 Tax=Jannaschia pohangensis TaxID=390807 RepID=A0A1I3MVM4_9RHOB|nr:hypothetical protein [Jannaschia pohangensis]SFJ01047.1 Zc3h12a-like Ribonuclease NYN domain-containing protein [Jannaschia pohangensis]